ncbi:SF1B family DNA helicase RecD2 [Thermoflavimicrobium dichotomicum]|uniref:ATP-dependent RecD2 DNA helicase n=1 Tax=Thermoflavimicrobium dichotomicum TaxID=46223 RepID=A0A1I3MWA5_9BACL|nr:ATP-dependent RecD-like DNA helicase [Thermoflavimicrobium dichotomicum]SFJ01231.1 exodeoxyribonuclease V alpha subunit [Thermoflavimicrobium dichotomicum]
MTQEQLELFSESYIKGSFIQEIFYNEENGYGVYLLKVHETSLSLDDEEMIVVGHLLRPHLEEEIYTCYGELRKHPRFGLQFHIQRIKKEMPQTEEAIVKYLSSDLFPGIGKKIAKRIVDHLGMEALDKIAANPDVLTEIKGISKNRAQEIADSLNEHHALEQAMVFLYQLGLGPAMALKIVQLYKHHTISMIKENPYRLIDDVEGIGFRRADELAQQQGMAEDAPERLRAAILYVLKEASQSEGHVFLTKDQLMARVDELLGEGIFSDKIQQETLGQLVQDERIYAEEDRYYLPSLFYAEVGMAHRVKDLLSQELEHTFPMAELYRVIGEIEEEWNVSYADRQREAMITALSSPLMILTGGPGTGKTTVIKGICQMYARLFECSIDPQDYEGTDRPFPIRLVAPTGRAAKRMSEATGLPAMTIHRLLGWKGDFFEHDAMNPISGSLLIVDEVSMLDIWLANQLFRAIPKGMQVILVGDQDQLPSVGPGKVLYHLLQVKEIPRVELTEIFRQAEGSSIIRLAHAVKNGEAPDDLLEKYPDRRFFPCRRDQALHVILQTYMSAIRRGYTLFDVQVLAPIYKGPVGVDRINQEIQQAINPPDPQKKEIKWGDSLFRLGDKVLQLVNHPEHPVYNGDMGIISAIDEQAGPDQPVLWVLYDQQLEVPYKRTQLNQITLAYACSVHKAQGSEFPIVIFPILQAYRRMLERNLIYTGITRSKSYLILCGEKEAFTQGIKRQRGEDRNSRLKSLIEEEW